jgi:NitT/TauT family transport system substrate-binding protein
VLNRPSRPTARHLLAASLVGSVLLTACAGKPSEGGGSGDSADGGTIRVQVASESFAMLPQLLLFARDYLEDEGLEIEYAPANPNAAQVAQSVTDTADIAFPGSTGVLPAVAAGRDVVSIATITKGPTTQLTVSNEAIEASGVSPDDPLEERVQALEGLTLGLPAAGTVTDVLVRDLLVDNGIDPDTDVTIRPIADVTALVTAMREGQVDAIAFSPPTSLQSVAEGNAQVWVSLGDVPDYEDMHFVDVVTSRTFLENRKDDVEAFLRALNAASHDIQEAAEETAPDIKERYYPDLDQEVYDLSFENSLPNAQRGLIPTEEGFQALLDTVNATSDEEIDLSFEDVYDTTLITSIAGG